MLQRLCIRCRCSMLRVADTTLSSQHSYRHHHHRLKSSSSDATKVSYSRNATSRAYRRPPHRRRRSTHTSRPSSATRLLIDHHHLRSLTHVSAARITLGCTSARPKNQKSIGTHQDVQKEDRQPEEKKGVTQNLRMLMMIMITTSCCSN